MLLKGRKFVHLVLSLALLLGIVIPYGSRSADAAETRMGSKVEQIAAGVGHSLALKDDGSVVAWGHNLYGQSTVPEDAQSEIVSIAAGGFHSLALMEDGSVMTWGIDNQVIAPEQEDAPFVAVAGGYFHSLALTSNGSVVAWGDDAYGETIVPADAESGVVAIAAGWNRSMALKDDGSVVAWGFSSSTLPEDAKSGVVGIAAGFTHSLALKDDGSVVAWGSNSNGQTDVPADLNDAIAIAAGWNFSLALKDDGSVVAWGDDSYGQTDVPPEAQSGVIAIAAGPDHALALKNDGAVIGWGDNIHGQIDVPGNDNLGDLKMEEGAFAEPFSSSNTSYTSYIGPSVSSVHVTATLADTTYASLYVNNQPQASGSVATVGVSGPSAVIPVQVEPYLKAVKRYTITVIRDSTPPEVQFDLNGNALPAKTATSKVTVTDTESGVVAGSLQYAWTQSTAVPTGGWTAFANGDSLRQTSGDGDWYLHIRASDSIGNVVDAVSNAFVLDNAAPDIALAGSNPMYVPQGGIYAEPGATATDAIDGNIPASSIGISGTVDTASFGTYPIQYSVADRAGNTATVTRNVYVYDGDAPAIYLNGTNPITVEANGVFTDPGATAQDAQEGDLSASIVVTGTVDTRVLGTYRLDYDVSDSAGNAAQTVTRSVYVQDTQPPVLELLGDPVMNVQLGETFTDPGAKATDAYYGDISSRIVVTGTVNMQQPGDYTLRYNVLDPSGNEASEVSRTVRVIGTTIVPTSGPVKDTRPYIDLNGNRFDSSQIDATKQSITLNVMPNDAGSAYASIPASVLADVADINDAFTIEIKAPYGSYLVPVDLASIIIGFEDKLAAFKSNVEDISFKIKLTDLSGVKEMQEAVANHLPYSEVKGAIVDFEVDIVDTNTREKIASADRFSRMIERVISLPDPLTEYYGAFLLTPSDASFVPARVGRLHLEPSVTIQSYSNSVYVVVENALEFADVDNHWSKSYVELAAAKGLAEGMGNGKFDPDKTVTRAEFTAMLVRALGRGAYTGSAARYDDVKPDAWYYSAVTHAKELGLLDFARGTLFAPEKPISREEMASMLAAAISIEKPPVPEVPARLDTYRDMDKMDTAYREDIRLMAGLNIMTGTAVDTFGPKSETTRAQAAVVLIRMLRTLGWIN